LDGPHRRKYPYLRHVSLSLSTTALFDLTPREMVKDLERRGVNGEGMKIAIAG
jgi:hypothetical protein